MFRWKHTERRRGTRACERKRDSVTHGDSQCNVQCDSKQDSLTHGDSKRNVQCDSECNVQCDAR